MRIHQGHDSSVEIRLRELIRKMRDVLARLLRLEEAIQRSGGGGSGGGGGGGGGGYCDAIVIDPDDSVETTVYEVRTAGDVEVGTRVVHNRYEDATLDNGRRIILIRNADGSYLVQGQSCPPPEEE